MGFLKLSIFSIVVGRSYSLLHFDIIALEKCRGSLQLTRGMNPGTPVVTTVLKRMLVLMSRICCMASSGIVETSKLSLMRSGLVEVVRNAVPRWMAQARATWAGVLFLAFGDGCDRGIFEEVGGHAVAEGGEGEQDDAVLFAEVEEFPFREIWVGFDLHDGGDDSRGGDEVSLVFRA